MTRFILAFVIGMIGANLAAHLAADDDTGRDVPASDLTGTTLRVVIHVGMAGVSAAALVLWSQP